MLNKLIKKVLINKKNLIIALKNLKNQKNSHGLNLLNSIKVEISKNALILIENEPSAINKNILKSQTGKIYKLLFNTYFNFYFYLNIDKKFSYPMEIKWVEVFQKKDIKINKFNSFLLFKLFIFYQFIKEIIISIRVIILSNENFLSKSIFVYDLPEIPKTIIEKNKIKEIQINNFKYFVSLSDSNLENIYSKSSISINKIGTLNYFSSKSIEYFKINTLEKFCLLNYLIKTILISFKSKDLTYIIISDLLITEKFKRYASKFLISKIFITPSYYGMSYTPNWFSILEKKTFVYHYSLSTDTYLYDKNQNEMYNGFNLSNWKNHLIWEDNHKIIFNKLYNSDLNYFSYKPFYCNYSNTKFDLLDNSIVIVDSYTLNSEKYLMSGQNNYYNNANNNISFLDEIINFAKKKNKYVYHKKKRESKSLSFSSKRYVNYLNSIKYEYYYSLPEDFNLDYLFKKDLIFICKPFTSFAILAKYFRRKVFYFDPKMSLLYEKYNYLNIKLVYDLNEIQ